MKKFRKKNYKLDKNQYLSEIEPFKSSGIPTDVFLFKTLPGSGATESELSFPRHGIILESNVPVIIGKCAKNKLVKGVYEGVTVNSVIEYLTGETKYKKLLVTPESFYKIKEALEDLPLDFYNDFFLLFDECEKLIQDVNYRKNITLPIDDFFKFKNKAFVSATPIIPSDPRFIEQNFKIIEIQPTFNYAQDLHLKITNNVFLTLQRILTEHKRDKYFIFFNTTDNIADFIIKSKIQDESLILCAKESMKKLRLNGFKNVSTGLTKFKKYNFFTCRFFSALDIDYETFECDPTIILVSDIVFALHSKIDPFTEAIQIPGRFRNTEENPISREIFHVTNVDSDLSSLSASEVAIYLKECHIVYKAIDRYFQAATSTIAKETLEQMLTRIDYSKFLSLPSRKRDYFMVDNFVNDEQVKGYYQTADKLIAAYRKCKHFNLASDIGFEKYHYTDKDRLKIRPKNLPLKDLKKILMENLIALHRSKSTITDFQYNMEMSNLQIDFPEQMGPINKYGIDNAELLKFNLTLIEAELQSKKTNKDFFGMMTYIQNHFKINGIYEGTDITSILKTGFKSNKIHGVNPSISYLRKFAVISDSSNRILINKGENGKEIRGYKIFKFLDKNL